MGQVPHTHSLTHYPTNSPLTHSLTHCPPANPHSHPPTPTHSLTHSLTHSESTTADHLLTVHSSSISDLLLTHSLTHSRTHTHSNHQHAQKAKKISTGCCYFVPPRRRRRALNFFDRREVLDCVRQTSTVLYWYHWFSAIRVEYHES